MRLQGLDESTLIQLLGGAILVLAMLFLLRGRRRRLGVGTAPVWNRMLGSRAVDLRALLALLLEILAAAGLVFALGQPVLRGKDSERRVLGLVVDTGATSQARDGERTRLQTAVALARELVDQLPQGDRAAVIGAGPAAALLTPPTDDRKMLYRVLDQLEADDRASDPARVMPTACRFLLAHAPRAAPHLIYLGDGQVVQGESGGCQVHHVPVGRPVSNLALTRFDARRAAGFGRGYELFVEVFNHGVREQTAQLNVFSPAATLGTQPITVPGRSAVTHTFRLDEEGGREGRLTALIRSTGGGPADGFAADDAAFALIPRGRRARVLLVTSGNLFLEKGLAVNPAIRLTTVQPAAYAGALDAARASGELPDVVVLDDVPAEPLPPGNALLFGPRAAGALFTPGAEVSDPLISNWDPDHPLLRGVKLSGLHIRKARPLKARDGARTLVASEAGPLLLATEQASGVKRLAAAFALTDSDLPLRVAFPVMLANFIDWCVEAETIAAGRAIALGVPEPLLEPGQSGPLRVTGPDGSPVEPTASARGPALRPDRAGFYEVSRPGGPLTLVVNFDRPADSSRVVRSARSRTDPGERVLSDASVLPAAIAGLTAPRPTRPERPLAGLLLLCAGLLVAALWMGHGAGLLR